MNTYKILRCMNQAEKGFAFTGRCKQELGMGGWDEQGACSDS